MISISKLHWLKYWVVCVDLFIYQDVVDRKVESDMCIRSPSGNQQSNTRYPF